MSRDFGNKLAVLASGFGSNLQALMDAEDSGFLHGKVEVVLSDRKEAFALERAKKRRILAVHVDPKAFSSRKAFDQSLSDHIAASGATHVVLAGFMRILSKTFVRRYRGKIVNIHPSLLPEYPGTNSIARAHAEGAHRTGVTVHFVDEGVDTGPVILQEALEILPGESLEDLTQRIHALEHRMYPQAMNLVLDRKVVYRERA